MANLSSLEKRQFEDLFNMASGYVLDFTNNSFSDLFSTTVSVNIYDEKYDQGSGSKANRLRAFWEVESDLLVGKVLHEMLSVWEYKNDNIQDNKAFQACQKTVARLLNQKLSNELSEAEFLEKDFGEISVAQLPVLPSLIPILESRLKETALCINAGGSLAAIFMCGSILEGALLGVALKNPQKFNQSNLAPKDKEGKVKTFPDWALGQFIDVAYDLGFLKLDVKKFSHAMRDFRNYIHPYAQMSAGFSPNQDTALICLQVLKAAISELSKER